MSSERVYVAKRPCRLCNRPLPDETSEYCPSCELEVRKLRLLAKLIAEELKQVLGVK